ncbi:perlucin-like [Haliotis cracherodii]|uniref:perlucin-like n=1 Tax=Haliotis cracherodii TaxID=6455 RepID=UPI0039EA746B
MAVISTNRQNRTDNLTLPRLNDKFGNGNNEELKNKFEFLNKRADRLSVHLNEMEQTLSRQIDTTGARHVQTLIDLKDIQEQLQPLGDNYRSSILFDSRNGCPERFTQFPAKEDSTKSNCFWFSNFVGSWAEAYTYCRMMGSNLAMVNNRHLRRFVTNEVKKRRGKFYFLGGTDLPKEGAWRWFSAKKHFFHRMWKKREPNNAAGAEHCLAISRKKWVDIKCDRRINFICQINLSSADQGR